MKTKTEKRWVAYFVRNGPPVFVAKHEKDTREEFERELSRLYSYSRHLTPYFKRIKITFHGDEK